MRPASGLRDAPVQENFSDTPTMPACVQVQALQFYRVPRRYTCRRCTFGKLSITDDLVTDPSNKERSARILEFRPLLPIAVSLISEGDQVIVFDAARECAQKRFPAHLGKQSCVVSVGAGNRDGWLRFQCDERFSYARRCLCINAAITRLPATHSLFQ